MTQMVWSKKLDQNMELNSVQKGDVEKTSNGKKTMNK